MNLPRVAVVCDYREENWPSMDLVGEMLSRHLQQEFADSLNVTRLCPPMRRRLSRFRSSSPHLFNADRVLNRFWDYQRSIESHQQEFDLFHLVDHSYGQLLHSLPPLRTVVTCHDLDTFRCLIEPNGERRSKLFQRMTMRVLSGFRRAAVVACDSSAIRDEILAHDLIPSERLRVVPLGVHPSCRVEPDSKADAQAGHLLKGATAETVYLLHVGSTIKRKRIDVLLKTFAEVRSEFPHARLVRVGGKFSPEQLELLSQLKLEESVIVLPFVERDVLAAVYRRAALVLLPSEREGFGLPVVEAMACGTPVVASDLPVLREVGADAAVYCPVGDIQVWSETVINLLREREDHAELWAERVKSGLAQSAKFSWGEYARRMAEVYREVLAAVTCCAGRK